MAGGFCFHWKELVSRGTFGECKASRPEPEKLNCTRQVLTALCAFVDSGSSCQDSFCDVITVNGDVTRATLIGLKPAQSYHIRVCATNREGTSGYSNIGSPPIKTYRQCCILP